MDAQKALAAVLRAKGYETLRRLGPLELDMEGEVDVAAPVRDAAGDQFWVLLKAIARLRRGDVLGWERRIQETGFQTQLKTAGVTDPVLPYAFGLRESHTPECPRQSGSPEGDQ